jgi:hypothetical protein
MRTVRDADASSLPFLVRLRPLDVDQPLTVELAFGNPSPSGGWSRCFISGARGGQRRQRFSSVIIIFINVVIIVRRRRRSTCV